jgi:hypothetical protein
MTIFEVCQQMDTIGKISILFLEDCICTQLGVPTTVLMTQKLQNGWCHCVEQFNHRSMDVSSQAWSLNASVILTISYWNG